VDMVASTTRRARYWLSVVQLRQAAVALEFGTDHGTHVLFGARVAPHLRWIGVDVREDQVAANREQAARLGLNAEFYTPDAPEIHRVSECVGVLDTLEHTVHPEVLLEAAEACCQPGGVLVVSVPNGPWGLHAPSAPGYDKATPFPGGHVGVDGLHNFCHRLSERGMLIQAQIDPGLEQEGNSTLLATYAPLSALQAATP